MIYKTFKTKIHRCKDCPDEATCEHCESTGIPSDCPMPDNYEIEG